MTDEQLLADAQLIQAYPAAAPILGDLLAKIWIGRKPMKWRGG